MLDELVKELLASGRLVDEGDQLAASNLVLSLDARVAGKPRSSITFVRLRWLSPKRCAPVSSTAATKPQAARHLRSHCYRGTLSKKKVSSLLNRVRTDVQALWLEVSEYNAGQPEDPERSKRVTFYCGQSIDVEEGA